MIIKTNDVIFKTREYLNYIEEHYKNVVDSWILLQEKCKDMSFISDDFRYESIGLEIRTHDMSKLSAEEFVPYRQKFYGINKEKIVGFKEACNHHIQHNPHHWENWTTKTCYHPYEPEIHLVHMICDWMAMGKTYNDTAKEYYEKNKNNIIIPQWSIDYIYEIFDRIYPNT